MFVGDYHTHTRYSDGKGSVLENAAMAKARGLTELAITDHCFHLFGRRKDKFRRLTSECAEAKRLTGVGVIAGVEADVISLEGDIDLTPQQLAEVEYLVVGFHKFAPPKSVSDFFKMYFVTYFNGLIPTSAAAKARNTAAVIAALERYPVKVLAHLGHSLKVNVGEVARVCAERGVLVEINAKHLRDFKGEWQALNESGANFILSSDAHRPSEVGALEKAFQTAVEEGISPHRIVNYRGE